MNLLLIVLAAIQIIVETLPISSSGHMRIAEGLAAKFGIAVPERAPYFDEFLHLYTLVVALLFFRNAWAPAVRRLCGMLQDFCAGRQWRASQKMLGMLMLKLLGMLGVTTVGTVLAYLLVKEKFADLNLLPMGFAITAVYLLMSSLLKNYKLPILTKMPWYIFSYCFVVVQMVALMPGISRFAGTTSVGLALGLTPRRAVQWSWFIFVPLMAAAGFVHGIYGLVIKAHDYSVLEPTMIIACSLAAVVSYGCLFLVNKIFEKRLAWALSLYMLVPIAVSVWLW